VGLSFLWIRRVEEGEQVTDRDLRELPLEEVVQEAIRSVHAHLVMEEAARVGPDKTDVLATCATETDPTWHDLRHYYASLLIRHGESVKTVQAGLGHASAVETLDTYAHLWPDSEDPTRQAVEDELGSKASSEARAQ
jgi:integrase